MTVDPGVGGPVGEPGLAGGPGMAGPNGGRRRQIAVRGLGLAVAAAAATVLAARATQGATLARATAARPVVGAGPWWVVLVAVALLAGTGALPAWRLVGARPLAFFVAPCLGALVAAVSAVVTVVGASEPLRWYIAFAAAANAAALASTAARGDRRAAPGRAVTVVGTVPVMAAVAAGILGVGRVPVTAVARRTWVPMAAALVRGHHAVAPAMVSSAVATRLLSSPLGAGCAAVTWLVTGVHSTAAATAVLLVVTASAVGAAACAIVEVGPAAAAALGRRAGWPVVAVRSLAALGGAAWCLAAFGVAGRAAVGGDLTLLWSAAVVAAAVLCLVLPPTGWRLRAATVLAAVAVLAGPAGAVAAAVLVVLVGVRRAAGQVSSTRGAWRLVDVAGTLVALAAVGAWPLAAAASGVGPPSLSLPPGGVPARLQSTWQVVGSGLWPAVAAGAVAMVGTGLLRRHRRACGLAADTGPAGLAVAVLAVLVLARGWDTPAVRPLLLEPAHLATALPLLVAFGATAVWTVVGGAVLLGSATGPAVPPPVSAPSVPGVGSAAPGAGGGSPDGGGAVGPPAVGGVDAQASHVLHPSA